MKKIEAIRLYKKYYTNKPSKFDIWWYRNECWKYCLGFIAGEIIISVLFKINILS